MKTKKMLNAILVLILVASTLTIMFTGEVAAQSGDIISTDADGNTRNEFLMDHNIYFEIWGDSDTEYRIRLYEDDDIIDQVHRTTDEDGFYASYDDGTWFDNPGVGEYHLQLAVDGEPVDTRDIIVYEEQDFTENSNVITTEDDYETEKNYFFEGEPVYFRAMIRDQYDHIPETQPPISLLLEKEGEDINFGHWTSYEDGDFWGAIFNIDGEYGNYTLRVMDAAEEEEYARTTFTLITMDISLSPDVDVYTQNQEIEIHIDSNFHDPIDVAITNSTEAPYRRMEGAHWTNQELENDYWMREYQIPLDEEDGTYYVVVNRSEDDEILGWYEFDVRKFVLDVETEKDVYLPGEEVKAFYTVTNLLDGSEYTDVDVEWRFEYEGDEGETKSLEGEGVDGRFEFVMPEDAEINVDSQLQVWANDTQERYEDHELIWLFVGDLNLDLTVDQDEYLIGQTLYVTLETSVPNIDVDIEVEHEGDIVDEMSIVTDGSGHYTLTIDSSGLDPGAYVVRGNATWNELWDTDEDGFELIDEIKRLSVHLETDRGVNPYYPGDQGTVSYRVTLRGRTIHDANVRYRLYSDHRVLDKGFAYDGNISFQVPSDYNPDSEGDLEMDVEAVLDLETMGSNTIRIRISNGDIMLNPSQWEYQANENISFEYEFVGIDQTEVDSLEYRIEEQITFWDYEVIEYGTPEEGYFEFTIPEIPADSYDIHLEAVTHGGARISTDETISLVSGFYLRMEILTESDYTSEVYEPGQEITISYELVSRDGSPLPETVRVVYGIGGYPESMGSFRTNETEGTFTFTVPETVKDGGYPLFVMVGEHESIEIIDVESDPSWGYGRIAGSFGYQELIMTLLIVIALIIGGMGLHTAKQGQPKKPEPSTGTEEPEQFEETDTDEEETSEFYVEEGEPEPEDQWQEEPQIEPEEDQIETEDREW